MSDEALVVRESEAQHRRILLGVGAAFLVAVVVVVASRGQGFTLLFVGLLAVPSAAGLRAARRGDWALRIDAQGLHWRDGTHQPWAGVGEIRVAQPGNLLTRLSGWGVYGLLVVTTAQADFARRAGTQPDGRILPLGTLTATPDEIITAVHRFAPVPVVSVGRIRRPGRYGTS